MVGPASVARRRNGVVSAAAGEAELSAGQATAARHSRSQRRRWRPDASGGGDRRRSLLGAVATGPEHAGDCGHWFDYVEMWAQDVGAVVGYHAGAAAVAEDVDAVGVPRCEVGFPGRCAVDRDGVGFGCVVSDRGGCGGGCQLVAAARSVAAGLPVDAALQVGQAAAYPASVLIGPMMRLAQMDYGNTAGVGRCGEAHEGLAAADVPALISLRGRA